jgi:hypothetical protein
MEAGLSRRSLGFVNSRCNVYTMGQISMCLYHGEGG